MRIMTSLVRPISIVFAVLFSLAFLNLAHADLLGGDTAHYTVSTDTSSVFESGSVVVGPLDEFATYPGLDVCCGNDSQINVDISNLSILFTFPSPNGLTFRYGYETISISDLNFPDDPLAFISGISVSPNVVDTTDLVVGFGPHEVDLHLGNSAWYPGNSLEVDLTTSRASPAPVPEPASWMLLGTGLLGAGRLVRRKRNGRNGTDGDSLAVRQVK